MVRLAVNGRLLVASALTQCGVLLSALASALGRGAAAMTFDVNGGGVGTAVRTALAAGACSCCGMTCF